MKILVLCYEYPPVGGGGGRLAAKVAEALALRGHSVRALSAGLPHLSRDEVTGGVRVLRPWSGRRREDTCSVPEMGLYLVTALPEALRQAGAWKPDVIHAHFIVPTGILALALNVISGIPYVLTAHLGDVPGGVPEQTSGLFRLAAPAARAVWNRAAGRTAVSGFVADLAQKAFHERPEVILNGMPPIGPPQRGLRAPGQPLRLLMVGRLSIQKDPLLAIAALARVRSLAWKLEVIGQGPLESAMREECKRAGLCGMVRFAGWLGEEEVRDRMRNSDVLLITSSNEGLPMAAIEALWHGMAIVGSRIGGLADVVEDRVNGLLCERTAEAFGAAIERVGEPATLAAMRKRAYERAELFDFGKSVDAYERALAGALMR